MRRSGKVEAFLKADKPSSDGEFGRALAFQGETLVVGAPLEDGAANGGSSALEDSGAAYVFARDASGAWRTRTTRHTPRAQEAPTSTTTL